MNAIWSRDTFAGWPLAAALLALAMPAETLGQTNDAAPTNAPAEVKLWFQVGEELVYSLHWGVLPIGEARLTTAWIEEDGQRRLQIRDRTRSSKLLAAIYPVDDLIESVVDPATFLPIRFTKNLKEGKHRYDEVTTFDYERRTAFWESHITREQKQLPIREDTRDLLTFLYFTRSRDIEAGAGREYQIAADDEVYDVSYEIAGVEAVKLEHYGPVASYKIKPETSLQGLFVHTGQVWVWVSRDERRIATKITAAAPIGHIRATLREVIGSGDDRWNRPARK